MRVLHVCSGNNVRVSEFITEQIASLRLAGVEGDLFLIEGKGIQGYLSALPTLSSRVRRGDYDVVHAHFGLSGMLAVLQRRRPVVISFIGEMNFPVLRVISRLAMRFADHSIFVSEELRQKARSTHNYSIIPYGVDLESFRPRNKADCRRALGLDLGSKIALFASSPSRQEKNYALARDAVRMVGGVTLICSADEYERREIPLLFGACDLLLLTSTREGSPQVIKEALACNVPIVSTDVGDVKQLVSDARGCYITSFEPCDVAHAIQQALAVNSTNGREKVARLSLREIAKKVRSVYEQVVSAYDPQDASLERAHRHE